MRWQKHLDSIEPLSSLRELPSFGFTFFFRNMTSFCAAFWVLSLIGVVSTAVSFYTVYLLGDLISRFESLSRADVLYWYLPLWIAAKCAGEALDYFLRRYAEAFPDVYADLLTMRFYRTLCDASPQLLFNMSKERLRLLIEKYTQAVRAFLADWFWGMTSRLTRFVIIVWILAEQGWLVLGINLAFILFFLCFAFFISKRFSAYARRHSEQALEAGSTLNSFAMNFNVVRRLDLRDFLSDTMRPLLGFSWERLNEVRVFHAGRWFVQLNLFNALFIFTLVYGILQVQAGELTLGFLVLIRWAFQELWSILVYFIEYYVSLIQQREDATIVRRELGALFADQARNDPPFPNTWREIVWNNVQITLLPSSGGDRPFNLQIPALTVRQGDKIGILGESGAGKSTVLGVLLGCIDYSGSITVDGVELRTLHVGRDSISLINSADPLFRLSLMQNILLGALPADRNFERISQGVLLHEFASQLEAQVGTPSFNLSTGQEQRVRLVRGLLPDVSLYLLDEAFNGIDTEKKRVIRNYLKESLATKTIILVTHDATDLEIVTQVYEIRNSVLSPR